MGALTFSRSGRTLLYFSMIFLASCGFNNKFEVPSQITGEVTVKNSTQTVNVTHTIAIGLELTSIFQSTCTAEADAQGLQEPIRSEAIKLCVAQATQKFMNDMLALINGVGANQGGQ